MTHVEKRGPRRYMAVWNDPDGRRRSRSFERKIDADRFLATMTVDVLSGRYLDPAAGDVTFGAYAAEWIEHRPIRPSTRQRYRALIRNQCGELAAVPLGRLEPSMLRAWQAAVSRRSAPSTASLVRGVVAAVLKSAVVDRKIAANPLDGVPTPTAPARRLVEPMPLDDVFAIHDAIAPNLAAAITLGFGAGLRRGEAFGLTLDRVDFLRRTITVDRQLVGSRPGGLPVFAPPKTAASVRVIPVGSVVLDELAAHLARWPVEPGPGYWQEGDGAAQPLTHAGLIFRAARGGPVIRAKVGEAWGDAEVRAWARRTGRPLADDGFRIPAATLAAWEEAHPSGHGRRFHLLRHVYASALIRSGASVKVVQARLGHASAQETLDTYSHMWPDDDDATRSAVDAMFARERHESDTDKIKNDEGQ